MLRLKNSTLTASTLRRVTKQWKFEEENMKKSDSTEGQSASELIDHRIAELGDWRGETLRRIRTFIKEADPDVVEEWKWMGTPVWSHDGIICTGEGIVKLMKNRSQTPSP
jgi:hypothetical protein